MTDDWKTIHSAKSLHRILTQLKATYAERLNQVDSAALTVFESRIEKHWSRLFDCLHQLYGWQYDFFYTLEQTLSVLFRYWLDRPAELTALDQQRAETPDWFLSEKMAGGVLYVDLFSDNLARLNDHIPYFKKLGLTYLHLMPLFAVPHGDNDGGYAVSDYRAVNPDIGTMDDLRRLATVLRREGISLVLDFVFNHTSDDHRWAQRAKSGDPDFMDYYLTFPNRDLPDQYQQYLRDIFPSVRKGSFTWNDILQRWVWTTFNSYQWDLNYANPEVFLAMAQEMLFLANQGVEVLRLDAVAFLWKEMGTSCENLPQAHTIIQAFNAMARIAAPSLIFKSEAIVAPDEVIRYVHPDECQLSYNPLLMALLWEALATREVKLLVHSMKNRYRLPEGCSWVNYIRCHDDIGWTFDDQDAAHIGIDPIGHRRFLNDFYTGRFADSFAKGLPFQFNADTGDLRICGTLSSLAGLESALEQNDEVLIEQAVRRISLLWSIQMSIGGIPLLYIGDEWGMLNDYTFLSDPTKINDSRWVHRCRRRWDNREDLSDQDTLEWRFFHEMVRLIQLRTSLPALFNGGMEVVDTGNPHLFGYLRSNDRQNILVVNNFSETDQRMDVRNLARATGIATAINLRTGDKILMNDMIQLQGLHSLWLDVSSDWLT